MRTDKTELIVLLDRSGSMERGREDHEGGLRAFIRDQRALAGDVRLTFARFDSHEAFELVYDAAPVVEIEEDKLELVPRGGTPLLDALGCLIAHVAERQAKPGAWVPDLRIAMVITDGQENASREWTKARITSAIAEREAQGWKFLYLGANVNEFIEAGAIGISSASALGYVPTQAGIHAMYASAGRGSLSARASWQAGSNVMAAYDNLNFTDSERRWAKGETTDNTTEPNKEGS